MNQIDCLININKSLVRIANSLEKIANPPVINHGISKIEPILHIDDFEPADFSGASDPDPEGR